MVNTGSYVFYLKNEKKNQRYKFWHTPGRPVWSSDLTAHEILSYSDSTLTLLN